MPSETQPPTPAEMARVEQCDRDAAADYIGPLVGKTVDKELRSGKSDHVRIIQAFARHRAAAYAAGLDRAAEIADYAVERAERDWRNPDKQDAVKQVGAEIAEVIRSEKDHDHDI